MRCFVGRLGRSSVLEVHAWIRLGWLAVAKLDNGEGFENRTSQPLCSTLSGHPVECIAWSVPLRISVGSDGARGDDEQEEQRNEAGDAVQDAHSNCRVAPVPLVRVLIHASEIS